MGQLYLRLLNKLNHSQYNKKLFLKAFIYNPNQL